MILDGIKLYFSVWEQMERLARNKNSIKIIGENTELSAQGYFVYDSKNLERKPFLTFVLGTNH